MKIKVVIGANYGDEGKGLVTNFLTRKAQENGDKVIVCLSNGGPQRGHTVLQAGERHIFHHFGSGTLSGADTYISRAFFVNPMTFISEYNELYEDNKFKVYIDPYCLVTTPFDMIINQITSRVFGYKNSCGFGIWETYKNRNRSDKIHNLKWFKDSLEEGNESAIVNYLQNRYLSLKVDVYASVMDKFKEEHNEEIKNNDPYLIYPSATGTDTHVDEYCKDIDFHGLIKHWVSDLKKFFDLPGVTVFEDDSPAILRRQYKNVLNRYSTMIVENGQGLLLDKMTDKVYGTPSDTTGFGSIKLLNSLFLDINNGSKNDIKVTDVKLVYVTRHYLTRHGDGPMIGNPINPPEEDKTNVPNMHQGTIRFSSLDTGDLRRRIQEDYYKCRDYNDLSFVNRDRIKYSVFVTHGNSISNNKLSQIGFEFRYCTCDLVVIDSEDYPTKKIDDMVNMLTRYKDDTLLISTRSVRSALSAEYYNTGNHVEIEYPKDSTGDTGYIGDHTITTCENSDIYLDCNGRLDIANLPYTLDEIRYLINRI